MNTGARRRFEHPAIRTLLSERLMVTASAALALVALATGRVAPSEIPGLLDGRLLALFFVLTIAVELGRCSNLFDVLVAAVVRHARHARALAFALVGVTGLCAALLTNDVALLLVVPFTMLFRRVIDLDLAPLVVLEIAAANLLGSLTPIGNPQNLFLYARGGFTPGGFLTAQLPFVAASAVLLAAAVPLLVPPRNFEPPASSPPSVDLRQTSAFLLLLGAEVAALAKLLPWSVPLALSLAGIAMLGGRIAEADFSLVFVFAFLFVGVEGLARGRLFHALDPERHFGGGPAGLVLSGALLSQAVSNVPAAMMLAPAVRTPQGFTALLYGVNAGGCGTPIASIANLIGAQLYFREGGRPGAFWRRYFPTSFALLAALALFGVAWLRFSAR